MDRSLNSFARRIRDMNRVFGIDLNDYPTDLGYERVHQLHQVLQDEINELHDLPVDDLRVSAVDKFHRVNTERVVGMADLLCDLIVYSFSEAARWGIPIAEMLHLVMDSQDSKLVDGKPLIDEKLSKFIKGPNYEPPEPKMRQLIESLMNHSTEEATD